ncbi:hypothetical protein CR164_05610 [Prosthecochloris marina]|uniref:Uncharacterized protein n=1 Tax=Prosthecochloris marina TaxID=2017681 RepID=A0A317TA67_9CHLB|nr:hypothetical protein CR164_05610 [Prosthecochloris marina]
MLNGSFKGLWNKAMFLMGGLWAVLVFLIWNSNQLPTTIDRQIFLVVIVCGYFLVYFSGFFIEARHRKKLS